MTNRRLEMARTGRPRKNIDAEQFNKLCGLQCTEEEIAAFFDCSVDTIENFCKREFKMTFSEIYKRKRDYGKISLRRSQWKLAEKYPSMAIFLGKQFLGQTDKIEATVAEIDPGARNEIEDFLNDSGADDNLSED